MDRDPYLAALVRSIHLNPGRAGLVEDSLAYRWSGHRVYLGQETRPWMAVEGVLGRFGRRMGEARRRSARFVQEGLHEGHRGAFHRGPEDTRVLGDEDFVE